MTLSKQVQRIVAREIRPYILPLPYSDYDDPVWIAAFLNDEEWLDWLELWARLDTQGRKCARRLWLRERAHLKDPELR